MGLSESNVYTICNMLMLITFALARIVFGSIFTFQLLVDTYQELTIAAAVGECKAPAPLLICLCTAACTISCLNFYWFKLMCTSLAKILLGGQSWTEASEGKNE